MSVRGRPRRERVETMSDAAHKPSHPYHLVDPSPWPIVGAIAGGFFTVGMVLYMHDLPVFGHKFGLLSIAPGVLLIALTMILWWRDVIKEAEVQHHHTPVVQIGLRYGMALFIASEVMFFAAFFWAFFDSSLFPKEAIGHVWPPTSITPLDPLALTVVLGILFTSLQAWEYAHAPFGFKDGIYTSTFFMATGFHGFHVIIGTTFLIVCLFRAIKGHFTPDHHFGFEAAAWYWHFVDVVWLFLFSFVYIWGSGPGPYAG